MRLRDHKLLAQFMETNHVSARQLAAVAGYSAHSYINRLRAGDVDTVTPDAAKRIAAYFGVPVKVLFVPKVSTNAGRIPNQRAAS